MYPASAGPASEANCFARLATSALSPKRCGKGAVPVAGLEPADPEVGGVGGGEAGLAPADLAQELFGRLEDLRGGPAQRLGIVRAGDVGRDAGVLEDTGQVGQLERHAPDPVARPV